MQKLYKLPNKILIKAASIYKVKILIFNKKSKFKADLLINNLILAKHRILNNLQVATTFIPYLNFKY